MITAQDFSALKLEPPIRTKNGLGFTGAGGTGLGPRLQHPAGLYLLPLFLVRALLVLAGLFFVSYRRHWQVDGAIAAPPTAPALF